MKKILNIGLVAFFIMTTQLAWAQKPGKLGHINSNDLLLVMPEKDTAEAQLQEYAKQLELQMTTMTTEYQKKLDEYQKNGPLMNDIVKASKEEEIVDLQRRIQEFQGKAQQSLQEKEAQIMEPIIKKAKDAIEAVAKENGYTYVFDTGVGALLYYPDGDDILPLVKAKMGITQ